MEEIWKDIPGREGYYWVSNFGMIKSKTKVMRPTLTDEGYFVITLTAGAKRKNYRVHRLVAMAFIPNPDNKLEINHINSIKIDNTVSNLEWCTVYENIAHSYAQGRRKSNFIQWNQKRKKIKQLTNDKRK